MAPLLKVTAPELLTEKGPADAATVLLNVKIPPVRAIPLPPFTSMALNALVPVPVN